MISAAPKNLRLKTSIDVFKKVLILNRNHCTQDSAKDLRWRTAGVNR